VDAACQLAQLGKPMLELVARAIEHLRELGRLRRHARTCHLERERQRDEPLLCTVVQVALDASTLGVAGRDDPGA
jgi:hypothetical protein